MDLLNTLLTHDDLYLTEFPQGRFLWRLLSLKEYYRFNVLRSTNMFHPYFLYWKVFQKCYQGDPEFLNQNLPLGIPLSIGECIMFLSGDCESQTVKEELSLMREVYQAQSINEVFKRVIVLAFPTTSIEELDNYNRKALIRKFVEAEAMMQAKSGDSYKPLLLDKITNGEPTRDIQASPVDFRGDNLELNKQASLWDEEDVQPAVSKPLRLSKEQLAMLDKQRK